jgi:hypothetical protein
MTADRVEAVTMLLTEAERAHGTYEADELGGVYDQHWADWYAAYAVEHGIGEVLGHDVSVDRLGPLLGTAFADFEASGRGSWAPYVAQRIVAES